MVCITKEQRKLFKIPSEIVGEYQRLLKNIRDCRRISEIIGEYQKLSENIKNYWRILAIIGEFQRLLSFKYLLYKIP